MKTETKTKTKTKTEMKTSTALNVIIANEKGGEWKSTLAASIGGIVLAQYGDLTIFEVDDQTMLVDLFKERASQLILPENDGKRNALADTRALEPALAAMTMRDGPITITDLGANHDRRVTRSYLNVDIAAETEAAGRVNYVLVPMHKQSDSVLAASRTIRRMSVALGAQAKIIPCMCGERSERLSVEAKAAWERIIEPEIQAHGVVNISEFEDDVLEEMSKLGVNFHEMVAMAPEEVARKCDLSTIVAKSLIHRIMYHFGKLREELEEVGLFRE